MTTVKFVTEFDFAPKGTVFRSPIDWREQFIYFLLVVSNPSAVQRSSVINVVIVLPP